ncbi:Cleavage and polyadenylation specificity factor subunit 1 [Anas platyrhynchos]|uniref:Cleavage and polyadenylation specificity factor subunit 1 n=1 Tax=Anas platyrhynchos TaxID=8839 RepID=R0KBJ7_ANAPL|nr:Cleavage and polyadenylation specificity factor subunit 1 [Anas platyrhynchos]
MLSVVEYDPGTHDLKTLSLHYFEEPELRDGFVQNVHIPKVRVDPDGRCAVMLIYGTRLVVLPFRRDSLADEHEGLVGEGGDGRGVPRSPPKPRPRPSTHSYVLTLITDGMRSVRSFHFDKAAASEEPPMKKKRSDSSGPWAGGKSSAQDEVDEIEVYGSEAQSGTQLATYSFEVCDSILNIGPCANAAMGEPAFLSEEFQNSPEPDLEIVLCSGYGKNGALSVLQVSVAGPVSPWHCVPLSPCPHIPTAGPRQTGFKQNCSLWTQIYGHELELLKHSSHPLVPMSPYPFVPVSPCPFVPLSPCSQIPASPSVSSCHPCPPLPAVNQLHFIPVDLGSPIVHCAVADPFVVILSAEGQASVFALKSDGYGGRTHRLALQKTQLHHVSVTVSPVSPPCHPRVTRGTQVMRLVWWPWCCVTCGIVSFVAWCCPSYSVTRGVMSPVASCHPWCHITRGIM